MKRTIAGILLVMAMGAGTMFADDYWRDRRDIYRDEAKIAHDRRELRRDLYDGDYRAAAMSAANCAANLAIWSGIGATCTGTEMGTAGSTESPRHTHRSHDVRNLQ